LDLSYTIISGKAVPVLAKLNGLEDLNLNNTNLQSADFSQLAKLPKLKSINLRTTQINDNQIKVLTTCRSITTLDISNNSAITDSTVWALSDMANLESVNVANTSVTLSGLAKLSRLKRIIVSNRDLKGQSLLQMRKKLPQLELDAESQQALKRNNPNAEDMRLFAPTRY
jgi:Leucine-rich repeat (LRR) protein